MKFFLGFGELYVSHDVQSFESEPLHYHVYAPVEKFIGRADEFNSIKWLHLNDRFVTIVGPRGIGKSELVKKYIEYYKQEYWPSNIIWLNCENTASFVYDMKVVAFKLGIHETQFQKLVDKVMSTLIRAHKTFLVFDNVNEKVLIPQIILYLESYEGKLHVALTTRQNLNSEEFFSIINLPPFTFDEVKELVQHQLGDIYIDVTVSDADILQLAELTDYNPELLIQSIDYIRDQNKFNCLFTIKDFLVVYNETNIPFLEEAYNLKENDQPPVDDGINLFIIAQGDHP